MRPGLLLILVVATCLLPAGEADPTLQRIVETARGLIRAQREDGSWPDPRAHQIGLTWLPPPAAAGQRSAVPGFCFAAEALWRVRTWVPEAAAAAARAHLLAAKALLAEPHRPVSLEEAIPFLLADAARASPEGDPVLAAAEKACRECLDQHVRHGSTGATFLGLVDSESPQRIDLMLTCLATDLLPPQRRAWLAGPGSRISRFQPLFPGVRTDGAEPHPGADFDDGTAFAVGLLPQPDEAAMDLLRTVYGDKGLQDMELLRALVCMRVFARRAQDLPDAWWRVVAERWTAELAAKARRRENEQGAWLEWFNPGLPLDIGSGIALHWLAACQQIRANDERRADQERLARERDRWQEERITQVLARLHTTQHPDGFWGDGRDATELTPLAVLGFLGMGFDHKTPNRYQQTVKRSVQRLRDKLADPAPTRVLALHTMALCEAYAMTADEALREPCQQGIASLRAARLAEGSWDHPSAPGRRHWQTTTLAVMALKSAYASGLTVPIEELQAWWPGTVGDVAADSLEDLAWKATAGVFLGWKAQADEVLMRALIDRTSNALPADAWTHYACSLSMFQSGGAVWESWMARSMNRPLPAPTAPLAEALVVLLADSVTFRYMQVLQAGSR